MKLHSEAKWIASHAWSFRFLVLAAVLTGAEAALPLIVDYSPVPRRVFAAVMFAVVAAGLVSRLILQQRPPQLFEPATATPAAIASIPVPAPAAPLPAPVAPVMAVPATPVAAEPSAPAPVAEPEMQPLVST